MVMPRLIHPIPVTVERLNTAATVYDDDASEPVRQANRAVSYNLQAQVKWTTHDGDTPTQAGLQDVESGYLLFRKVDCDAAGYTPTRRDRITRIGTLTSMKLYIVGVKPRGHYPDQGGHSLWQCDFRDRAPVVENG